MKVLLLLVCLMFPAVLPLSFQGRVESKFVFNLMVNGQAVCTAFAVEGPQKEKVLLTAGHCADDLNGAVVTAYLAETNHSYAVHFIDASEHWPDADYAIFRFTGDTPDGGLQITAQTPNVSDEVYTISGPLEMFPFLSKGYYAGRAGCAGMSPLECPIRGMSEATLVSAPGSSGAPVFDRYGRVWGILVGANPRLSGLALIVPVPDLFPQK